MKKGWLVIASAFVCGLVFGGGLLVSGMTKPSKILGFLDVGGAWDPSLAFVMGGALLVAAPFFRPLVARGRPLLGGGVALPELTRIDPPLVLGSVLFGLGWGLAGVCPGPALVMLATFTRPALTFAASMIAGMLLFDALPRASAKNPGNSVLPTPSAGVPSRAGDG